MTIDSIGRMLPAKFPEIREGVAISKQRVAGKPFETFLDQLIGANAHRDLVRLQQQIGAAAPVSDVGQLLVYQIRVGQLGLRTELLSRVAEAAMGTVRRLQSPQ